MWFCGGIKSIRNSKIDETQKGVGIRKGMKKEDVETKITGRTARDYGCHLSGRMWA